METKTCNRCSKEKLFSEFIRKKDKYAPYCKECEALKLVKYRQTEQYKQYWKDYYQRNRDRLIQKAEQWNKENYGKHREIGRRSEQKHKDMAYASYGGYKCQCCGETERSFLVLDHVNDDGAKNRRAEINSKGNWTKVGPHSGAKLYRWLRNNNYPPYFQVLCSNCNLSKARYKGVCIHDVKRCNDHPSHGSTAKRPEVHNTQIG